MFFFDFPTDIQNLLNHSSLLVHWILFFILGLLAYLTYKKPLLGAVGVIILFPTYLFRTHILGIPSTFLEISFLVVFLIWLIKNFQFSIFPDHIENPRLRRDNFQFSKIAFPILLLVLSATISVFVSPNTTKALGLYKAYVLEPLLFFFLLINVIKTEKDKETLLWALGVSGLPIALFAIIQKFTGVGIALPQWQVEETRRVTAIFTSPNAVGLYLGPITAAYMSWLISGIGNKESEVRIFLKIVFIVLMLLAAIFTVSRGTWFGLLAAMFFIAFVTNKKWTLFTASIIITALLLIPQTRNALAPLIFFQQHSGQNRIALWKGSLEYLTASPKNFIFGAGIFGFPEIHEIFRDPLKTEPLIYPHNILLNFWMDFGLLGLIAFAWIFLNLFKKTIAINKKQSAINHVAAAAFIAILAHGIVDVHYFKNDLAMLFWTIASLAF